MDSTHEAAAGHSQFYSPSGLSGIPVTDYALAAIAGIWLADGVVLLLVPRTVMTQVRDVVQQSPRLLQWELLSIVAGLFLAFAGRELPYQPLWFITAGGMVGKGLFLTVGPQSWRDRMFAWCEAREDVDLRFWGLGLSSLAVLLLHALGWIGRT